MAIIAKYKFNPSLYADYLPTFNKEFTGYIKTDVTNSDGTITRTISHDTLKPTTMRFGINGEVTDREKSLLEVIECDTSNMTSMFAMFQGCSSLTSLNTSNFNTDNITNISSMFSGCSELTSLNLSSFNTSKVTNMNSMFNTCNKLISLDLSSFNTSQVTNMSYMFFNCSSLTSLDLSNFNTSKVTSMNNMFNGCNKLISLDLSSFDTSKVTNISWMFGGCSVTDVGLLYATSSTINSLVTALGTSTARNIYYTDAPLNELTVQDNITYKKYELTMATLPYTLNKLPNGVADYIDVVNKVHVQRVGEIVLDGTQGYSSQTWGQRRKYSFNVSGSKAGSSSNINTICDKLPTKEIWTEAENGEYIFTHGDNNISIVASDIATLYPITVLYELKTPIYTPLTEEEIAQLPLSAYADGYVNLSSDQLTPSFEFRMRASNRYQVDMLETGYYYLNAPVGNVKLGTANVDVQQMPCIVKVDNVGTGDSGYRLGFSNGIHESIIELTFGGYFNATNGQLVESSSDAYTPEYLSLEDYGLTTLFSFTSCENKVGSGYGNIVILYNEEKEKIAAYGSEIALVNLTIPTNAKYFRVAIRTNNNINPKAKIANMFITLVKLPSHRIPSSFTQGMKCGTNFGYWEGIMVSKPTSFRTVNISDGWSIVETSSIEGSMGVVLNRIESGNTVIEDEFDVAIGKFTKRVGKYTINGNSNIATYSYTNDTALYKAYVINDIPNLKKYSHVIGFIFNKGSKVPQNAIDEECWQTFTPNALYFRCKKDRYSCYGDGVDGVKAYFNANPTTIYYELEVPEISYLNTSLSQVKTVANTGLQCTRNNSYLNPQVKPSHLTYPVPSLVGNRTYTVVHNRKNIANSTKPIELNLGGTVVQLNDASSKTLVKTPSTLAHSNLIFIGGESTVDHIMVLDGDWTNKPIEYFENMMGHDTDAIITIIGDSKIDDVAEQYLW